MDVVTYKEEVNGYDPLSQANKHIMLKNGLFEFELDNFKQSLCVCSHSNFDHLECKDVCLSREPCICERFFLDKYFKTTTEKHGKLPKKETEDNQLNSYIRQLAKM